MTKSSRAWDELVDRIVSERRANRDCWTLTTAPEGWGKSEFTKQLDLAIDPGITADDVIMTRDQWYETYDPRKFDQLYDFDEAQRILFNRNWHDIEQRSTVLDIMEMRQLRNIVNMAAPRKKMLDSYVRNGRIGYWIVIPHPPNGSGEAVVQERRYNSFTEEVWYDPIITIFYRKLEEGYPDFARAYEKRKHDAHVESFEARVKRARTPKGPTVKERFIASRDAHPKWSKARHAKEIGVPPQSVYQLGAV